MPVYNGERYLSVAIRSILGQTFRDFEFLIINDGSTDMSEKIIRSFPDPRIRLVSNETNLKLIATLNKGFLLARGDYIARMDCDDISLPKRLQKQVSFLDTHSSVVAVGTWYRTVNGGREKLIRYPKGHGKLRSMLLFACPLMHPTVMLRREPFVRNKLFFNPDYPHAEDYELWSRVASSFELAVMDEVLLRYRVHQCQVTMVHRESVLSSAGKVQLSILRQMGLNPTDRQIMIHRMLSTALPEPGVGLAEIDEWICEMLRANSERGYFPTMELVETMVDKLLTLVKKGKKLGEWGKLIFAMRFFREVEGAFGALGRFLVARIGNQ
jgi:glycosyltransferase involved in cell wall biosynthesis